MDNRGYNLGTENASIVVDCFEIYVFGRCGYGWDTKKITIGKLIKLWESGYLYNGYPIIEYRDIIHNSCFVALADNQILYFGIYIL